MPIDSRTRLRTLITESYQLPPLRFRVEAQTVDVPRLFRTAKEACEVATELGATRIEFLLPDRAPIVFGLRQGQWRARDEASLADMQRHLDQYCVGAIGDRFDAATRRGREPASLFASHARRDLIELRQIQDPLDFERAASIMIRLASNNAAYRYALSEAMVPRAQTSQGTVEKELMRMVGDRIEASGSRSSETRLGGLTGTPSRRPSDSGQAVRSPAYSDASGTQAENARSGIACAALRHDHTRHALDKPPPERNRCV